MLIFVTCDGRHMPLLLYVRSPLERCAYNRSGTLTHMAPETLLKQRVSKAGDVFAFGMLVSRRVHRLRGRSRMPPHAAARLHAWHLALCAAWECSDAAHGCRALHGAPRMGRLQQLPHRLRAHSNLTRLVHAPQPPPTAAV